MEWNNGSEYGGRPTKRAELAMERVILANFCSKATAKGCAESLTNMGFKVSRNTVNEYYREFRELIFRSFKKAPRFKGEIEIDEKEFGRRKKPRKKRKAKKGEYLPRLRYDREKTVLVLAILERGKKGSRIYTHIVPDTKRRTLSPIIHMIVEGKSLIYTDGHKSYGKLKFSGYRHKTVVHKRSWTNGRGVHVNGVESFWSVSRALMKRFCGVPKKTFPLHIKECEFRHNNRGNILSAMKKLLKEQNS